MVVEAEAVAAVVGGVEVREVVTSLGIVEVVSGNLHGMLHNALSAFATNNIESYFMIVMPNSEKQQMQRGGRGGGGGSDWSRGQGK